MTHIEDKQERFFSGATGLIFLAFAMTFALYVGLAFGKWLAPKIISVFLLVV